MQHQNLEFKELKLSQERIVHFNDNTYKPPQPLFNFTDQSLRIPSVTNHNHNHNHNNTTNEIDLIQSNHTNQNRNTLIAQNIYHQSNSLLIQNTDPYDNRKNNNKEGDDNYHTDDDDDDDDDSKVYNDSMIDEYEDKYKLKDKRKKLNEQKKQLYNDEMKEIRELEATLAKIIYFSKKGKAKSGLINESYGSDNKYYPYYSEEIEMKGYKAFTSKPEIEFIGDVILYSQKRKQKVDHSLKIIEKASNRLNNQIHLLMEQMGSLKAKIQFTESKNKNRINKLDDSTGYYKNVYTKKLNRIKKDYPFRKRLLD
ncbi:unnamed protein product [Cunninghamella blakesleeana]